MATVKASRGKNMRKDMGKLCAILMALIVFESALVAPQSNVPTFALRCGDCFIYTIPAIHSGNRPHVSIRELFSSWFSDSNTIDIGNNRWNLVLRLCPPRRTPPEVYTITIEVMVTGGEVPQISREIIVKYVGCKRFVYLKEIKPFVRIKIERAESLAKRAMSTCSHFAVLSDVESKGKYDSCCKAM